jgi:multidrug efflux pump subunit AcrA (membrane-fusion protein)
MPGMFAQVSMIAQRQHPPVIAPDSAIVVKPEGQFVVVYDNGSVHYQKVTLGRDFGKQSEVTGGLQPGDQVLLQPTTDLTEGQKINPDFVQAGPAKS